MEKYVILLGVSLVEGLLPMVLVGRVVKVWRKVRKEKKDMGRPKAGSVWRLRSNILRNDPFAEDARHLVTVLETRANSDGRMWVKYQHKSGLVETDPADVFVHLYRIERDGELEDRYGQENGADAGGYDIIPESKCVIFSKGKITWEGVHRPFEQGDIVITNNNEHAFIYSGENDRFWECFCGVYCGTRNICINSKQWSDKQHKLRLATEKEKEKLFQVIKDNGYEWNNETKALERSAKPTSSSWQAVSSGVLSMGKGDNR